MVATAFRLDRHFLNRRVPAAETVEVARRLCGVQAQVLDNRSEYQPVWLRTFKVTATQMERLIEAVAPQVGAAAAKRLRSGRGEFLRRQGRKLAVRVDSFARLGESTRVAIAREARSLARHLGGELDLAGA
jgi:hypothetical protein